jgi:hypothetical protein
MAGDQSYFPPGGIHMNDNPDYPNEMLVGHDDLPSDLQNVPEGQWIHVETVFYAESDQWTTAVTWGGGGGGAFSGTSTNDIAGQIWFGGWAFKSTMDAAPVPPGGVYDNVWYIDNFSLEVVPEPSVFLLAGLGLLALLRRKK